MSMVNFTIRTISRAGKCRGCNDVIPKGDTILYKYSSRNTSAIMIFCMKCVEEISKIGGLPKELPDNCRNVLVSNNEPYPKSGCAVCGNGGIRGCPYE